jgi:hypothetical protein
MTGGDRRDTGKLRLVGYVVAAARGIPMSIKQSPTEALITYRLSEK